MEVKICDSGHNLKSIALPCAVPSITIHYYDTGIPRAHVIRGTASDNNRDRGWQEPLLSLGQHGTMSLQWPFRLAGDDDEE